MTDSLSSVPLFPLNSIILPKGRIPLQLFEPRYIDMLTRCLKEQQGFVVVLLQKGQESGLKAAFHSLGTYVRIIDFQQLDNGLLGITVEGERKVRVVRNWQQDDGLHLGDLELVEEEAPTELPGRYHELLSVLQALFRHPVVTELEMAPDFDDAREVGWRLTELLPLDNPEKQSLLEMQDPLQRLDRLLELVEVLERGI